MEYFEVQITGSAAAYQEISADGERFTDADGNTVDSPQEPIHYTLRSWVSAPLPWMNASGG